jgi:hypothetical protein
MPDIKNDAVAFCDGPFVKVFGTDDRKELVGIRTGLRNLLGE